MNRGVAVFEICLVSSVIQLLLALVHPAQVLEIVGVAHRFSVWRVGEIGENQLTVPLGHGVIALACVHQIKVIVHVETVHVVWIVFQQACEFCCCGRIVLKLVLEDDAHVVQALLDDFVGRGFLLVRLGNLRQVVFRVVWIGTAFHFFFIDFWYGIVGGFFRGIFVLVVGRARCSPFVGIERALVAASPVILQLSGTPAALEFGFAGIAGGRIVEVP